MEKQPKFTRTTNTDGTHTVYVNGKKGFRGTPLDADSFVASYRAIAPVSTGTVTKISASHDRMTLVAKFVNGDKIRLTLSRIGITASVSQSAATKAENQITKEDLRRLLAIVEFQDGDKTNKDRFHRTAAALEKVTSLKNLV